MAKTDPSATAMQALTRAVADPTPRPLYGTKVKPGIFDGSSALAKAAAAICLERNWIESTGRFEGAGKGRKELYRITREGMRYALEHAEPVELLRDILASSDQQRETFKRMRTQLDETQALLDRQAAALGELLKRVVPPDLDAIFKGLDAGGQQEASAVERSADSSDWIERAAAYVGEYRRRNPHGDCPLPELYHQVAEPLGVSIGQFHDGIRQLASRHRIRLHPFTGADYQLREGDYALLVGQEIKYYAAPAD